MEKRENHINNPVYPGKYDLSIELVKNELNEIEVDLGEISNIDAEKLLWALHNE